MKLKFNFNCINPKRLKALFNSKRKVTNSDELKLKPEDFGESLFHSINLTYLNDPYQILQAGLQAIYSSKVQKPSNYILEDNVLLKLSSMSIESFKEDVTEGVRLDLLEKVFRCIHKSFNSIDIIDIGIVEFVIRINEDNLNGDTKKLLCKYGINVSKYDDDNNYLLSLSYESINRMIDDYNQIKRFSSIYPEYELLLILLNESIKFIPKYIFDNYNNYLSNSIDEVETVYNYYKNYVLSSLVTMCHDNSGVHTNSTGLNMLCTDGEDSFYTRLYIYNSNSKAFEIDIDKISDDDYINKIVNLLATKKVFYIDIKEFVNNYDNMLTKMKNVYFINTINGIKCIMDFIQSNACYIE